MSAQQDEALRLADALEQGTYLLSVERDATAAELRRLHAKVAELEAQLEAIGAGGVGPLMARGHAEQPAAVTFGVSERAVERDELLQVALNFIQTLTGMQPPPIEIAPPEVFAPFRDFVDRIQAVTDRRSAPLPKKKPLTNGVQVTVAELEELKNRVNTLAALTTKRDRYLFGIRVKREIAELIQRAHGIGGEA